MTPLSRAEPEGPPSGQARNVDFSKEKSTSEAVYKDTFILVPLYKGTSTCDLHMLHRIRLTHVFSSILYLDLLPFHAPIHVVFFAFPVRERSIFRSKLVIVQPILI
jgi:hypothetical protein